MTEKTQLQALRKQIDDLDEQLQVLLRARATCVHEVAELKRAGGENNDYYRPQREAEILRNVSARGSEPLAAETMACLFREIMSACRALEGPLRVAYLGPQGTYTETAARKHFGHAAHTLPGIGIDAIFRDVEANAAHYGVVPVENSTEGVVNHTLDKLVNSPLKICGEIELRIHHCLLSRAPALASLKRVYAHQQSLAQCRGWLDSHAPTLERVAVSSNAEAARIAIEEEQSAAIAGDSAALYYHLPVLAANIEDQPDNTTRFLVIGRDDVPPSGRDKTSLLIFAHNRPGALYRVLEPLARHDISMTRIESRPSRRGMWDYVFFVDIEGHIHDANIGAVLEELHKEAVMLKVLGSYPAAMV